MMVKVKTKFALCLSNAKRYKGVKVKLCTFQDL